MGHLPSWVIVNLAISRGCFVDPKFFLVVFSLVQGFFSWVFRGSKIFLVGYFVSPRTFSWVFRESKVFCVFIPTGYFVSPIFSFSWLILWFKDFRLLTGLERVTENRSITVFLSVTYSRLIGGGVCHLFLLVPYLIYSLVIHKISTRKKTWTHEISMRINFGPTKILTRKKLRPTKYPREKISDSRNTHYKILGAQNTHKKKILTH